MASSSASNFHDAPEGCVATIIGSTTPADAFHLGLVSKDFLSASESDIVWEKFLPSDCDLIFSRSDGGKELFAEFQTKKQLYKRLATLPLLVDHSSKSFWLEKSSGKKCWMVAAKSLSISWGNTPEYWRWISHAESRFLEVAELISVCWFDVSTRIQTSMLSHGTQYDAYLVFNMTEEAYGFRETFEASVQTTGGKIKHHVYLDSTSQPDKPTDVKPVIRTDGWKELKIGEFFNNPEEGDDEVELYVREVKRGNWKKGLIIQGIEVRPTKVELGPC